MPVPKFMGKVNKRVFNPMEIRKGKRPVLIHRGRRSGRTFLTPLDAHQVDGGYVFIVVYGADSDWVRNILASGDAKLRIDGKEIQLGSPRIIGPEEAWSLIKDGTKRPAGFLNVSEFLRMDLAGSVGGSGESDRGEDVGVPGTSAEIA